MLRNINVKNYHLPLSWNQLISIPGNNRCSTIYPINSNNKKKFSMRKIYSLMFVLAILASSQINAQISVSGGSSLAATYTSLTKAGGLFAALNATPQTGNTIVVSITGNSTTEDGANVLNAGAWTSITISPSGGAARTISGAVAAGSPMISFSGADNVTINGLNTGGNSLTISNTTAAATTNTSTIRFLGGAINNTITNCTILGSFNGAVGVNGGNIYFATDANTANGNDNNTISNCTIGPAGANLPSKAIYGNGSTTTAPIGNNGIIINNNNIVDVFGAAVQSAGIYVGGGCSGWTITNNRIYQTTTKTFTAAATNRGIDIQNATGIGGAQGFTITGNIIGYASSTQTGTYTLAGATFASKFNGIVFNGLTGGTSSSISGNTIASISVTGVTTDGTTSNTPFAGILITSGTVTASSNTIGSQSATGSLVFSTNTILATDVYGIFSNSADAFTSSSNTIGGITVTNAGASGSFLLYGLRSSTTAAWTAASNIIGGTVANSISLSATGTGSQVAGMFTSTAGASLTLNTIRNLTSNIGAGTSAGVSVAGIIVTSTGLNNTVSQNTIYNLSNSNASAASTVTGIHFSGSSANVVNANSIYALTVATNSNAAEIDGIRTGGGTTIYSNNMIALGAGSTVAIGAAATDAGTAGINGIVDAQGTNSFWNNSVYIGGTPTSGSGASFAFNGIQTTVTRSVRNNIFVNSRSNGAATGKHYAVKINGTAANPAGLTINNNIYFANGTGGVFGFFNSADVANIGSWRTAAGQDAASYNSDPKYTAPAGSTPDLHISTTLATPAEANGVDLGVTTDFDGQTRSGLTPVDIGADAGSFTGIDLSAPTISYTPLNNTCTLTGVTLTATITDASGVPTSGAGLPKLYWKVNSGAYSPVTATFVSGSTYTFSFGTGSTGNVISYYIVAQDNAATPNVTASPSAGAASFTANPPAAGTAPTTPSSFTLQNSLGGSYNVGAGQTYTTLSAAIAAYNTSCLSSAVTFNLTDAAYTEAAAISINANSFASATNTLTIKPTQAATSIAVTGGSGTAVFVLNGADYVIIDGSTGSTANSLCPASAASRNLTVTNTSTSATSAVVWLQTTAGGDAATNNIIKNCNLVGNSNTTTLFAVGSGAVAISTTSTGTGNNNNAFVNNNISKTQYGIYSGGLSSASKNSGNTISQNLINTASPNNVGIGGILVGFENNITISGNTISEINGTTDRFAISAGFGTSFSNTTTVGSEVTNATITSNIIGNVIGSGASTSLGIALGAATSGTSVIANNMVYGVSHNSTSPDFAAGIVLGGGTGSSTKIYHNTVSMQGTITGVSAATQTSACLAVTATSAPTLDIRNNIFSNTQANNSGSTMRFTAIALGYSSTTGNYSGLTGNNNDLYAAGSLGTYTVGITAGLTGTNRTTLAAWTTETGRDGLSKNVLPVFSGTTNLHLDNSITSNTTNFDGTAASGTGIAVDIDCDTRNATTPDMGADEFSAPGCSGATGGTASGSASFCGSGTPTITATGYTSGANITYQWYSSTNIGGYPNGGTLVSGQTNPASLTTGTVSATTYYWLRVTCTTTSTSGNSTMVTVTVNPIPAAVTVTGAGTFCGTKTITAANGNDGTIYFQGTASGGTSTATASASQVITVSGTYYFRARSAAGCWGTEGSAAVVINPAPSAVTISPSATTMCAGGVQLFTASGGNISGTGTLLSENFNAGTNSWTTTNNSTGGTPSLAAWTLRPNGYVYTGTPFNSNDNTQFYLSNSDEQGSGTTSTILQSPVMNASSFTSLSLSYYQYFEFNASPDEALVEVSTNGSTWTPVQSNTASVGTSTSFAQSTVNLDAYAGSATLYVRFRFTAAWGYYLALDNVSITGQQATQGNIVWTPNGTGNGLFSNAGATTVYSGAASPTVYASPASTTTYTATATLGGCSSSANVVVTVNPNFTINASAGANGSISPTGTTTLSCNGTGSQTYTITANSGYAISDVLVDGISAGAVGTYTFNSVTANHSISASFVAACINAGISNVTSLPSGALCSGQTTTLTANGVAGTSALVTWFTGTNGTGTNLGTGNTLSNRGPGIYYARVTAGCGAPVEASLTISSTGNVFSGTGNWTDNARWSCGAPPASGDNITIAAGANATLNTDFTVDGNFSMTATSTLAVNPANSFTVGATGNANFAGNAVTFKSNSSGTASLGKISGTLSGATNVTVERFIPQNATKAWRLLASNTTGQTIKQAWQENQTGANLNSTPGYGTMIPGSGGGLSAVQALGFDTLSPGKSLFKYNPATDNLDPVLNTNSTQLSDEQGYFIFIRGDRGANQFGAGAASSSTVLRSTGTIYQGTQTAVSILPGKWALVRNPYPSRIDMRQILRTGGLVDAYQVWDPKLAGTYGAGAFQTFTKSNADYIVSPGGGSYGANGSVQNYIESGAAFFAQASGSTGSVQITENAKASGSQVVFRPAAPLAGNSRVLFNLYAINLNTTDLVDGGLVDFNDAYSNAIDVHDVRKSPNFGENFGMLRNNTELVVERRSAITSNDSIFFNMYQLRNISYRIDIETNGFDPQVVSATLQDKFTGTSTSLDLAAMNSYTFTVTTTPASYAADRFTIVLSTENIFSGTGNWTDNARWSRGTVPVTGDAVVIAAGANATLNTDFTVGGSLKMTPTSTLTVNPTRTLAIGNGATANFNGQAVSFKSDATGTATLGQVNGTLTGATNVTIERYIPNNGFRSWRLLSVPTFGNGQTVRQAWQEGDANPAALQNNLPGFGTQITGPGNSAAASQAQGFDNAGTSSALLSWNGTGWTAQTTTNQPIAGQKAWFLYVRGERSKGVTGLTTDASATTLRTNGTLYTGDQVNTIGANATALIGNVYPSAINFTGLERTGGVGSTFYIWDSKKLNGSSLGAYQTFSSTNGFNCILAGGSYTLGQPNTTIESGQAFLVKSTTAGSLTLKESAKINPANGNLGLRPAANPARISSSLYNSSNEMIDANVVVFDAAYDRAVDADDAIKLGNPGANFAIESQSKLLAVEGTSLPAQNDVIQFRMWNLQQQQYRLEFASVNIANPLLSAQLEDAYLHTLTNIDLSNNTAVNFTVDANAASAAPNRFRIIFKQAGTLPISFVSVAANRMNHQVKLEWKVAAERNIRSYVTERSADGKNFSTTGSLAAASNAGRDMAYSFTDGDAPAASLYYRIKSIGTAGDIHYSPVVKVASNNNVKGYAISPNPVENGIVNLQFSNQAAGTYSVRIMTNEGRSISAKTIRHSGGNSNQLVDLPANIAAGTYQVAIVAPDNTVTVKVLVVNSRH